MLVEFTEKLKKEQTQTENLRKQVDEAIKDLEAKFAAYL